MNSEAAKRHMGGGVPWAPTLSSLVDCAAQRLGLCDLPLDAGDLMDAAVRHAGRPREPVQSQDVFFDRSPASR